MKGKNKGIAEKEKMEKKALSCTVYFFALRVITNNNKEGAPKGRKGQQ